MLMLNRWQGKQNYRLPLAAAFVISDIHLGGGAWGGLVQHCQEAQPKTDDN